MVKALIIAVTLIWFFSVDPDEVSEAIERAAAEAAANEAS